MSRYKQSSALGDVSESIFEVMREAVSSPGKPVTIPANLAARIEREMASELGPKVLEIRRRERTVSLDMLALHLG